MLISMKLPTPIPIKKEPEDEDVAITPEQDMFIDETKVPEFSDDDFEYCGCCKAPFKGAKIFQQQEPSDENGSETPMENGDVSHDATETPPRRGQLGSVEQRKVKEFYSFNVVTGELLHVTGLQAILSVFELRLGKAENGLNLKDVNDNLGFCQNCGTLISQLYKLHQEVTGMVKEGSVLQKLIEYEDLLTDNQATDFSNPIKRRRRVVNDPNKINGISLLEESRIDHDPSSPWGGGDDHQDDTWNDTTNYDMDTHDDDDAPRGGRKTQIKITSVGTTKGTISEVEDQSYDAGGTTRGRRASAKINYKRILDGDSEEDEDWTYSKENKGGRKKTGGSAPPPPKKSRGGGRPPKQTPSPRGKAAEPKPKPGPRSRAPPPAAPTAACHICKKVFPAAYLAEHLNSVHASQQNQPCLICGKIFDNNFKSIKHLLTHIPEKAFGCSRCHDTFKTAEERNSHTSSHLDFDKKMDCPKCPQSFTSLLLLNKHEAQKHRQTKSFLCSICAKLLTGKDEWINHILSHGPFQCYYCKEYLRPAEYKKHIQTVHVANRPKNLIGTNPGPIAEVTIDDD